MFNDLPPELRHDEIERNAYNAAFYELGLRWHWDDETYSALLRHSPTPEARIRHYLETAQAHLLKAYEPEFLARAIQEHKARHTRCVRSFDWSQALGSELGA